MTGTWCFCSLSYHSIQSAYLLEQCCETCSLAKVPNLATTGVAKFASEVRENKFSKFPCSDGLAFGKLQISVPIRFFLLHILSRENWPWLSISLDRSLTVEMHVNIFFHINLEKFEFRNGLWINSEVSCEFRKDITFGTRTRTLKNVTIAQNIIVTIILKLILKINNQLNIIVYFL